MYHVTDKILTRLHHFSAKEFTTQSIGKRFGAVHDGHDGVHFVKVHVQAG